jgi:hypothetical protein
LGHQLGSSLGAFFEKPGGFIGNVWAAKNKRLLEEGVIIENFRSSGLGSISKRVIPTKNQILYDYR